MRVCIITIIISKLFFIMPAGCEFSTNNKIINQKNKLSLQQSADYQLQ